MKVIARPVLWCVCACSTAWGCGPTVIGQTPPLCLTGYPGGINAVNYSVRTSTSVAIPLTVVGGTPPYTWSTRSPIPMPVEASHGGVPPNLGLEAVVTNTGSNYLSGFVAAAAGATYAFVIRVSDSAGGWDEKTALLPILLNGGGIGGGGGCSSGVIVAPVAISGTVRDPAGHGIAGVAITYAPGATVFTNASGAYEINMICGTTQTIRAVLGGYTLSPSSRTYTAPTRDISGQDYVGTPTAQGLRFVPVAPCRILDTRPLYAGTTWTGAFGPPALPAIGIRTIPITSSPQCNIPATAKAFVFNATLDTVYENTGPVEFVTMWPTGEPMPTFRTLQTSTGGFIANGAIVKAGTNGSVNIFTRTKVHMVLDIFGYFTDDPAADGLLFYPIGPCRAVDTRGAPYGLLPPPFGHQRLLERQVRTFTLPQSPVGTPGCQIPAARAYSLQMTLVPGFFTNGLPVAYLTAWPTGQAQPTISNMNSLFGYALANSGIVPAKADGSIDVFSYNTTNLILDVNGYFGREDGTGRGLSYYPVTQCRVLDTSRLNGTFGGPQLSPDADRVIPMAQSTFCPGLPPTAKAWALNGVVAPGGAAMPYLSMWPAGQAWPGVSQLNAFEGQSVSNAAIVPAGLQGSISVKVAAPTPAMLEVAGYFAR